MNSSASDKNYSMPIKDSPFRLENGEPYKRWRETKLDNYPADAKEITVSVNDPFRVTQDEVNEITALCAKTNMAIYTGADGYGDDKQALLQFGRCLGLNRIDGSLTTGADGVTELSVSGAGGKGDYIPYTNRSLGWHTDGCYLPGPRPVRGFVLHCVQAAAEGGESFLFDPEIAYIRLRDENPDFIAGLMLPDALTIPANIGPGGEQIRPETAGPVFSTGPETGALHMRYTARKRHVAWHPDSRISDALDFLDSLLDDGREPVFRLRLEPGWGIVCNNVLHGRTGFADESGPDQKRLLYRLYYNDRVAAPRTAKASNLQ